MLLGTDGDVVDDRIFEQVVQGGFVEGLDIQVAVLDVSYERALAFQEGADPLVDSSDEHFQRLGTRAG